MASILSAQNEKNLKMANRKRTNGWSIYIRFRMETEEEGSLWLLGVSVASVIPFIIDDAKKNYYYRDLSEWRDEKSRFIDNCSDGQGTFNRLMDMPEIQY